VAWSILQPTLVLDTHTRTLAYYVVYVSTWLGKASPIKSRDPVNILGWIAVGGAGESDRQVGINRVGKMTSDINRNLTSNPKPKVARVVWAK